MECESEKKIRVLLDLYMDGATTLDQERELKRYFNSGSEIAPDLQYARIMFGAFAGGVETGSPSVESRGVEKHKSVGLARKLWIWGGSVAALLAVVFVARIAFEGHVEPQTVYCYLNGEPVTDYNTAEEYTEDALQLIAQSLNKPIEYLAPMERFLGGEQSTELSADETSN